MGKNASCHRYARRTRRADTCRLTSTRVRTREIYVYGRQNQNLTLLKITKISAKKGKKEISL